MSSWVSALIEALNAKQQFVHPQIQAPGRRLARGRTHACGVHKISQASHFAASRPPRTGACARELFRKPLFEAPLPG